MYKLQHRVKLPDGRLKYIICRHINITVQTIYLYALILSMSVIYNCKKFPFQRYLLHIVEYVLNVVEHGVYKYLFLNVKENEISVYSNCKKVYIFLSVKYYILKWMKICISKLQTYISILTLIEIVYHVYILFSEYALHWFSRVLFIATQREIMSLTELIKVENVNKYLFPKLNKNEISMFLYCKNVNISLAAKYCTLTWCNIFMQTYISMLTIQNVFCVYTSFSEYVLGWFSPVLFIATHGEQMYTIGRNASQTHVLFCDFFKQLIWKSFRNITEVCEIIKYRHIDEPCYISLTLYHDRFSIPVSVYQQMWPIKTCFLRSISKMHLLECMYPHFVFNLSLISIKKICELTHNYGIIHTYFKVNPVIMTMSINSEIQLILTNDRLHVSGCLVNLIWGKVTIGQQKFKTEVGNDQLEFTGMIDFLNKVYICVYFFLYEYDILYIYCVIVSIIYGEFINQNLYILNIYGLE
jgi:hypothetical protein